VTPEPSSRPSPSLSDIARYVDEAAPLLGLRIPPECREANTVITTFGRHLATANTEYHRVESGRHGRQSQTWVRMPEGWRVVSAHVSFMPTT
jgi:AtzH-like